MHLVGAAMGFTALANFSMRAFLGTQSLKPPDMFLLGFLSVAGQAVKLLASPFALSFSFCFSGYPYGWPIQHISSLQLIHPQKNEDHR
jgi:hypothetical protein